MPGLYYAVSVPLGNEIEDIIMLMTSCVLQVPYLHIVSGGSLSQNFTLILHSSDSESPRGLQNYMTLISQRAKIEGFIMWGLPFPF